MRVQGYVLSSKSSYPVGPIESTVVVGAAMLPGTLVIVTDECLNATPQVNTELLARARAHIGGAAEVDGHVVSCVLYHHVIRTLRDLLAAVESVPVWGSDADAQQTAAKLAQYLGAVEDSEGPMDLRWAVIRVIAELDGRWLDSYHRAALRELSPAPSPDAALDEATVRAAKAWGVLPVDISVRVADDRDEPYLAVISCIPRAQSLGLTRLAAVQALVQKAKPRFKRAPEASERGA